MPEPRQHLVIGGQNTPGCQPHSGIGGIVYHICGGRFNVDTYSNRKSNLRQREQASDPARPCVGLICPGCGRVAERDTLASLSDLNYSYPGITTGQAIRRWQKATRNRPSPELPTDHRKYEQRKLF